MTSSGQLKRPLDFEFPTHNSGPSGSEPSQINGNNFANRNKRKCITYQQSRLESISGNHDGSPFKDPSLFLRPLTEDIESVIDEELQDSNHCGDNDTPILTKRQTRLICEKLIKDRELKLKNEYNRILACKIAEHYELLAKANYLNSYIEPRMPTTLTPSPVNPSISALAAAFTSMQRSVASAASAPSSVSELNTFSTQLPTNNHTSVLASSHLAYSLQQQAAAAAAIQAHQQRTPGNSNSIPSGPVLLVSNLDEQLATPEALFTLFGVFGDVVRVKILFNKKDNSLVQMADPHQAQVAMVNLDKQKIFGKIIRVAKSKHQLVQMPREGNQSDAGLTKDFTNSPLHRFKIPGSRNYLNIYPPSNTLHISNIPATIEESDLHKAFKEECGFEHSSFKFFPKDRKMALMRFNTIEQATIALIKMHNFQMSGDTNLRVSFSKSVMQH